MTDCVHKKLFALTCLFLSACSFSDKAVAQSAATVSGFILNEQTKEPVPFASIFLANTLVGTSADENGHYLLRNVRPGKYDLITSSVGYKRLSVPIDIVGNGITFDVTIQPETGQLAEIIVKSNTREYQHQLATFKKYFIGTTTNAATCWIVNIEDVDFDFNPESKIFTAASRKPLIIRNMALGYEISYLLDIFRLDYKTGLCFISGIPRFSELKPKNKRQIQRWTAERQRAYNGSITHFMRSLNTEALAKNDYSINLLTKVPLKHPPIKQSTLIKNDTLFYQKTVTARELLNVIYDSHCLLEVIYKGESPEWKFTKKSSDIFIPQTSYLQFSKHALIIHANGYYEDPLTYYADGYWSWSGKIAELMPLDYPDEVTQPGTPPTDTLSRN